MDAIEKAIEKDEELILDFKDRDGRYHQSIKKFKSVEEYGIYCDTRMKQSYWKHIGTNIYIKNNKDG